MSFYQNPFNDEYRQNLPLSDRQFTITFSVPPNRNQSDYQLAYNNGPYDLSGGGVLTINYAWDTHYKNWSSLAIDVTGSIPSATLPSEVIAALNENPTFAELFVANPYTRQPTAGYSTSSYPSTVSVLITPNTQRPKKMIKVYISNSPASLALGFNSHAGVAQLPTYFDRDTIVNRFNFPTSLGMLVYLDPTDPTDQALITNAGFNYSDVLADWQLLSGRSGIFNFQNITVDGSDRITQIIEYPAGAGVGYLARMIQYVYAGANTNPSQITEVPYTLTSGDLITPP